MFSSFLNGSEWVLAVVKLILAVAVGGIIGSERARHGRAAGMRTHILVCLGGALTSMTSLFVHNLGVDGDVFRISAQVISGVGFLGAGMIVLKNNNVITGLTTAAGVWATGAIGVAIGYGFYQGAAIATVLFMITIVLFAKFEKKKALGVVYLEIDDMKKVNDLIPRLSDLFDHPLEYRVVASKSGADGHIGINVVVGRKDQIGLADFNALDGVVFSAFD